jgi:hypothetical protein
MRNDIPGLLYPMNKTELDAKISEVLLTGNVEKRAEGWKAILTAVHEQAIYLPLTYMTNTAVMNRRLENFKFGAQQFDIPVAQLRLAGTTPIAQATTVNDGDSTGGNNLSAGIIAGIAIACGVAVMTLVALALLIFREKRGNPVFAPLLPTDQDRSVV